MPRRCRIENCGYHHVYNRGVAKNKIFLDFIDKEKFLKIVASVCKDYKLNIHSFCLMDNHYHLLVENLRENLSDAMRQINSQYAIYFNKRHKRVGHLWQDRYKSWFVLDTNHLFILFRYIEQNPIKAGMSERIGEYKYASSYSFLNDAVPKFLENSFVLREYNIDELFKVLDTSISEEELKILEGIKRKKYKAQNEKIVEDIKVPLDEIFSSIDSREKRDKLVLSAFEQGYKKSEIARKIEMTSAGVAKILKKFKV
ncbi:transposase [Sulfurospirillum sp. 1307]